MLVVGRAERGHSEAAVRQHAARPADVRQGPVEHDPPALVGVEPVVDQVVDEASGLRDAEDGGPPDHPGQRVGRALFVRLLVAEERGAVAHGGQAQARHARVPGHVHQVVQPPRPQPAPDPQAPRVGHPFGAFKPGEGPLVRRNLDGRLRALGAHGELGQLRVEAHRRVGGGKGPGRPIQGRAGHALGAADLHVDLAGDRLAALPCHGKTGQQPVVARGDLAAPAAPEDRVAVAHEKPVAGVGRGRGVIAPCLVERPEGQLVAPVVHVVEQSPVAPPGIDRRKQKEIAPELDLAAVVARGQLEVIDPRVGRVVRIDLEVQPPGNLLISPGPPEHVSIRKRLALAHLHAHDLGQPGPQQKHKQHDPDPGDQSHNSHGAPLFGSQIPSIPSSRPTTCRPAHDTARHWALQPLASALGGLCHLPGMIEYRWLVHRQVSGANPREGIGSLFRPADSPCGKRVGRCPVRGGLRRRLAGVLRGRRLDGLPPRSRIAGSGPPLGDCRRAESRRG